MRDSELTTTIKSELMDELDWPATAGEVQAAVELRLDDPDVTQAAMRLSDDASYLDIDALWADLEPRIDEVRA